MEYVGYQAQRPKMETELAGQIENVRRILRAMGIPLNMFPVMFAIGRLPGWISQWKESHEDRNWKLHRPRQIYIGQRKRNYIPIEQRG